MGFRLPGLRVHVVFRVFGKRVHVGFRVWGLGLT